MNRAQIHRLLLENSPDHILLVDRDGTIRFLNKPSPGYTKEKVLGSKAYDYLPEHAQAEYMETFERVFQTGKPMDINISIVAPDDDISRWFHLRFIPVKEGEEILSAMLIGTDITIRKNMEMQQEKLIVQLQAAQAEAKALKDIIPVCAFCKKVRDDHGIWHQIEDYITNNTNTQCSTAVCPECYTRNDLENGSG